MYHLRILTPEDIFYDADIHSLMIPGGAGYLGILENHTPIITNLVNGTIRIIDKDKKKLFYKVKDGFFEFKNNKAVLLVEEIEKTSSMETHLI